MPNLIFTPRMLYGTKLSKAIGYVKMHPQDFLALASHNKTQDIIEEAESVEQYNIWAQEGSIKYLPWLDISINGLDRHGHYIGIGKIEGHEGRHRAVSLIREGIQTMPVALFAYRNGVKAYKDEEGLYLNKECLPPIVIGQFSGVRFKLSTVLSTFKSFLGLTMNLPSIKQKVLSRLDRIRVHNNLQTSLRGPFSKVSREANLTIYKLCGVDIGNTVTLVNNSRERVVSFGPQILPMIIVSGGHVRRPGEIRDLMWVKR